MTSLQNPILTNIESKQFIEVIKSPFTLGRGLESDYVIVNSTVSRLQCILERRHEGWVLRDMSTNGTKVNDDLYKREVSSVLKHNDYINLGCHTCIYKFLLEIEQVPNMQSGRVKEPIPVRSTGSDNSFDDNGVTDDFLNGLIDNILRQPAASSNSYSNDQTNPPDLLPQTFYQQNSEYGSIVDAMASINLPSTSLELPLNNLPVTNSLGEYNSNTSNHISTLFPCERIKEDLLQSYWGTSSPYMEHNSEQSPNFLAEIEYAHQLVDKFLNQSRHTSHFDSDNCAINLTSAEKLNHRAQNNNMQIIENNSDVASGRSMPSTSSYPLNNLIVHSNMAYLKRNATCPSLDSHSTKKVKLPDRLPVLIHSPKEPVNLTLANKPPSTVQNIIQEDIVDLTNTDDLPEDEVIVKASTSAAQDGASTDLHNNARDNSPSSNRVAESVEKARKQDYEKMENELMCTICSNLFIKAVTIDCSHTFCEYCIKFWRKKKSNCPICRSAIKSTIRTLVLDNVVEKMMENAPAEEVKQRQDAVAERQQIEEKTKSSKKNERNTSRRGRRRRVVHFPPRPQLRVSPVQIDVVSLDSLPDDSNDSSEALGVIDYFPDDWYSRREELSSGYGGYGRCYYCGTQGHWANRCPYRPFPI